MTESKNPDKIEGIRKKNGYVKILKENFQRELPPNAQSERY